MLTLTGSTLNLQSYMGMIMSVGVSIANSVLLITNAEHLRRHNGNAVLAAKESALLANDLAAELIREHRERGLEIDLSLLIAFIETAVREASGRGVAGKAVTPFILRRIAELTGGRSLRTNIALAANNARLAAFRMS